jgi:pyrroloquinoline quinone (PQQ) biosynthesis protein C
MSAYEQLIEQTAFARRAFIELPLIQDVLQNGASKALYLDFLGQAYHHVRNTAPLLALAAARCGSEDYFYQSALFEYIEEERGHELWILEDIQAMGGDHETVRRSSPRFPCRVMIGHAYYIVDHVSPYGLLGMIHVLEGMAVALAGKAVSALRTSIAPSTDGGFKYLITHGDLDVRHAQFFESLVNQIDDRFLPLVIASADDFYTLYGELFRDLDLRRSPDAGPESQWAPPPPQLANR